MEPDRDKQAGLASATNWSRSKSQRPRRLHPGRRKDGVDGGTTPLPTNVWSHIAYTSDGRRLRFYVNGKLKGTASGFDALTGTGPLLIGGGYEGEVFDGLIDEVRVYNRALNDGEIAADLGAGLQTPSRTPVAAYSFDAGEGEVAEDVTGNEHDGAIEGATWFDKGKYGKALSFDGENDCVTVADAEDLRITEELTVEAWVKARSLSDQPIIYKDSYGHKGHQLAIGLYETGRAEAFLAEGYEGEYDTVEGNESSKPTSGPTSPSPMTAARCASTSMAC